jgi:hypothetical protein
MARDTPFSPPKKNHSGTHLPTTIFHPTNKAAKNATSKSPTIKQNNNKRNNQPSVTSPAKRRHFRSNKNRRNHRNRQTHDNRHYPNFAPALNGLRNKRGVEWLAKQQSTKRRQKALHHG